MDGFGKSLRNSFYRFFGCSVKKLSLKHILKGVIKIKINYLVRKIKTGEINRKNIDAKIRNVIPILIEDITHGTLQFLKWRIFSKKQDSRIIFVVGCQRSGTTILARILSLSPDAKGYGETDLNLVRSDEDKRLRKEYVVKNFLKKDNPSPFSIIKPLHDSQNISILLSKFEDSRAIWIYRQYADVVNSHIEYFKGMFVGLDYIRGVINQDESFWMSEKVPERLKLMVKEYLNKGISHESAYALCWYIRNNFYFEQSLTSNKKVKLVKYEELMNNPVNEFEKLFKFAGLEFNKRFVSRIHAKAINKRDIPVLDPDITELCENMQAKIDSIYYSQQK